MLITELNLSRKGAFSDKTKPLTDFGDINIFLGHNGTGKTTISREIANATTQNQVFNSDYIKLNIQQNLSGVVVIGHENIELKNQKDKLEGEKSKIINELTEKQKLLEDTKIKLEKTIQQLHNEVWSHVVDYKKDDRWINYFRPNWSNKSSMYQFYCEKRPKGEVSITYTDLENRQKSLFSKNLQLRALITLPIPPFPIRRRF